jgi:WXXGXW repeat (2 copies)
MFEFSHEVTKMRVFHIRRSRKCFGVFSWLLLTTALLAILTTASAIPAQVVLSVTIAPPALPVYAQPVCPGEGYIWTPGYWSYSDDGGYFWVPGTWVEAPAVGLLWTPGYWGWANGAYIWNAGYWGPQVGFYGGINYGFGYVGTGYAGGYWTGGHFFYNTRVNNVDVHVVRNVYQKTVVVHTSHVSYNGGHGGVNARPTAAQQRFAREQHTTLTTAQEQHVSEARSDRNQFASVNHGRPAVMATAKPGEFKSPGVVQAKVSANDRVTTSRLATKPEPKPRTESTTRSENKSRTEPKPEASPRTESKPGATHEPKAEAQPKTEPKPAATHEPKPEAKPKSEPKPAATHESKPESKPEAKPQAGSKPAPTHQSKPAAQPKSEPKPAAAHQSKPPAQQESAPREEERPKN